MATPAGHPARRRGRARLVALAGLLASGAACADAPVDRLLVTSGFTDQVFVLDAASGAVLDSLQLDRRPGERDEPHGVAVSPDGRHFYVTLAHGEPTLWKYESDGLRLVGRVALPTRGAARVRISPDGTTAAVPDYWLSGGERPGQIAFVRTADLTVMDAPTVCGAPHDAVYSPTGDQMIVTCAGSDDILAFHMPGFTRGQRVAAASGTRPLNAAWLPDGSHAVVTSGGRGRLYQLVADASDAPWIREAAPGAQVEVAGRTAVIANRGAGTVTLFDLDTGAERVVGVPGAHPHGVALSRDASMAYVTYEGDTRSGGGVVAIDLGTGTTAWHTEVGVFTLGVAYLPALASR